MFFGKSKIAIEIINIEDDGLHLMIEAKLNGKRGRMLIDTGASRTVFDKNRILKFIEKPDLDHHDKLSTGLGTDSMPTSSTTLSNFNIGDVSINDFYTILLDLSHVNASYKKLGFEEIDGVLGSDLLNKYEAVIDYKKKLLVITNNN